MGSGKSAVGAYLARSLGWIFLDSDPIIEQEVGMSIAEIFQNRGEEAFREVEKRVVMKLLSQAANSSQGTVISLGGGAVTTPEVAKRLAKEPLVFLLDEDIDIAFNRAQGKSRPLATDRERFRRLFKEREGLYRMLAGFIVDTRGKSVMNVSDEIVKMLKKKAGAL